MTIEYKSLHSILSYKFQSDDEIINALAQLQRIFISRDEISEYSLSDRLVSAYTLIYMTTNMPKLDFVLNQLPVELREYILSTWFIDFGSGPGTYTWRMKQLGHFERASMIEQSESMKHQSKLIGEHCFGMQNWDYREKLTNMDEEENVLFFGNSLNEIEMEDFTSIVEKIDPQVVFFIEPGTKDFFHKALDVRKILNSKDYNLVYPCPRGDFRCPMSDTENWCHQVIRVTHEQDLERICQKARMDRRNLPMISHVYTKKDFKANNPYQVRLEQETKYSFDLEFCHFNENKLELVAGEARKKDLSKSTQKYLKKLNFGENIEVDFLEKLKNGKTKIKIDV